jgi:hypothetical protein
MAVVRIPSETSGVNAVPVPASGQDHSYPWAHPRASKISCPSRRCPGPPYESGGGAVP